MSILRFLKNKYLITTLVFVLWLLFFDKNNLIDQYQRRKDYQKLKEEEEYYAGEIEKARKERDELFTSEQTLEKFAREKYFMKKDNEEVFIMIDTTRNPSH